MPDNRPSEKPDPKVSAIVVLAAGSGTRMRSNLPKVLHPIAGKPMLWHAITAAAELNPDQLVAVIGHGREQVGAYLAEAHPQVRQAVQEQQLGTGHAVASALNETAEFEGIVLVTYGDVPLLTGATLRLLATEHQRSGNAVTVLTAVVADPTGYGRIVRDSTGALTAIVEQKDADSAQREIREINSGVYAFDGAVLTTALGRLTSANVQGEQYLTDVVAMARSDGHSVGTFLTGEAAETEGVNDRVQLAELSRQLNARLIRKAQLAGVTVNDPATTWIHADVTVGPDTQLLPGTSLEAGTVIGSGCVHRTGHHVVSLSGRRRRDCPAVPLHRRIDRPVRECRPVFLSPCPKPSSASMPKSGPTSRSRSRPWNGRPRCPHLSYIGDATIGAGTNIGAGTITANYDGMTKSGTVIGENAFVGTNSTLVAPVTIGDGVYIGAGSTVTSDVEAGDLAVARGRQRAVKGWVLRRRAGTASDKSARSAGAGDGSVAT